jgi:hypothetical protein
MTMINDEKYFIYIRILFVSFHDDVYNINDKRNINIEWNGCYISDSEYITAFSQIVIPIAYEVHISYKKNTLKKLLI